MIVELKCKMSGLGRLGDRVDVSNERAEALVQNGYAIYVDKKHTSPEEEPHAQMREGIDTAEDKMSRVREKKVKRSRKK